MTEMTDAQVQYLRELRKAERLRLLRQPSGPGSVKAALVRRGLLWSPGTESWRLTGRGRIYADEIEKGIRAHEGGRGRNEMGSDALRLGWDLAEDGKA